MPEFAQRQNRAQSTYLVSPARADRANTEHAPVRTLPLAKPRTCSNQAMLRLLQSRIIQAKLTVGQPGDRYEQEADRVAETVLRTPEPQTAKSATSSGNIQPLRIQRMCRECDEELRRQPMEMEDGEVEEEMFQVRQTPGQMPEITPDLQASLNSIRTGGQPLPESVRSFFEPRFGYDFSHVRVHADARAAESARYVKALAFTVGRDIVFGDGQYAPGTPGGKRLLAHELAHTIQQGQGGHSDHIQRACGPRAIGPIPPGCMLVSKVPAGERFLFNVNCDEFAPGEETRLRTFARSISPTARVDVLGLASLEGPANFNESLSCHRADRAVAILLSEGISMANVRSVEATGGVPPAGDPTLRAVSIDLEEPLPKCGPDASVWFVNQVNVAIRDPAVLAIQRDIAFADAIARRYGTTAQEVAEGGAVTAVLAQEARMGSSAPLRGPVITRRLTLGAASGSAAASALIDHPADAARISFGLGRAAGAWRGLVNHGARYDFKAHTMRSPTTANCPDQDCANTITLCPGSAPDNCYLTDLPGNLFYALIGQFAGWSELTLQLGSQLAQLTGTGAWDPPQDTAAIGLGFTFPLPMTTTALCRLLPPARGSLTSTAGCGDCSELTTAPIV